MVLDMTGLNAIGAVDRVVGTVRVGSGTSIDELLSAIVPQGWFIPVTPGTRRVTIGGAVAADVHGKNHHRDGSFGDFVTSLRMVTPTGTVDLDPDDPTGVFWATVGGMGLTGVITEICLRLSRIESTSMTIDTIKTPDLDATMAILEESDRENRYSVAWVDCLARGTTLGRGIVTRGDHTPVSALPERQRSHALAVHRRRTVTVPTWWPGGLVNTATARVFNEAYYRHAPRRELGRVTPFPGFFHPLDTVDHWNRLYGPQGLVQYQLAVGPGHDEVVRRVLERLSRQRIPSFLAVLKRFGPSGKGVLSFPIPGWTLALDFPVGADGLGSALDDFDEMVAAVGGRIYLAKDARLRPELVGAMYPRLAELADARGRVDPEGRLVSDLARRLTLANPVTARAA